jgi:hypothetical protein
LALSGTRTAGCVPDVQGKQVDALWDSGAEITLVRQDVATELVGHGASVAELETPIRVSGIGAGEMRATQFLSSTVKFRDGTPRTLLSIIVPILPYSFIIGYDFMHLQGIAMCPGENGIRLLDMRRDGNPVIYSVDPNVDESDKKSVFAARQKRISNCKHQLGSRAKKAVKRYQERWSKMSSEDQDLLTNMALIRIKDLSEAELNERLQRSKLKFVDREINIIQSDSKESVKMSVPECDFPEYQKELVSLVERYPTVFSSSTADVGKSTGNQVTIRLAINTAVNVRNYRTPLKLRSVLKVLIDDLMTAGVIEKCDLNEFNSPVLLVPKKNDGSIGAKTHRMVVDYRALNKIIETVVYPMPR